MILSWKRFFILFAFRCGCLAQQTAPTVRCTVQQSLLNNVYDHSKLKNINLKRSSHSMWGFGWILQKILASFFSEQLFLPQPEGKFIGWCSISRRCVLDEVWIQCFWNFGLSPGDVAANISPADLIPRSSAAHNLHFHCLKLFPHKTGVKTSCCVSFRW